MPCKARGGESRTFIEKTRMSQAEADRYVSLHGQGVTESRSRLHLANDDQVEEGVLALTSRVTSHSAVNTLTEEKLKDRCTSGDNMSGASHQPCAQGLPLWWPGPGKDTHCALGTFRRGAVGGPNSHRSTASTSHVHEPKQDAEISQCPGMAAEQESCRVDRTGSGQGNQSQGSV